MTTYTKTGRPRMGTTLTLNTIDGGKADVKVVGHLEGKGPEGRQGLVGIVIEWDDGYRESLEWPLVPLTEEEKTERLKEASA